VNCTNFDILHELSKSSRNTFEHNHSSNHSNRNNLWIYQSDFIVDNPTKCSNPTRKITYEYHLRIVWILSKICNILAKLRYLEEICIGSFICLIMNFCLLEGLSQKANLPQPLFIKRGEKYSPLTKGDAEGRGI
jgi:hypothetical protein